jgi:ABC-type antimicrobial peptide transport system permease subunit
MLQNYFKIAWRNLLKSKGFSIINILGLAVGMAIAMLIALWIRDELTYNRAHANYDRIAQVWMHQTFDGNKSSHTSIAQPLGEELRTKYAADFEHVALGSWNYEHILAVEEDKILKSGMFAEVDLPELLALEMLRGSYDRALSEPNSILLAESVAQTLFGDADPMGKIIKVDNDVDVQVTGVFKDLPPNSELSNVYFYLPWSLYLDMQEWANNSRDNWNNHSFQAFVEISEAANMESVSEKIKLVEQAYNENGNPELFLHPMSKWHLYGEFKDGVNVGGRIQFVWLFGIIGLFVLLLACINFMNLSTARSEKRAREVGIRKTVGSMKRQLVGQFLSESLLVTLLASLLSILIVYLSLPAFNELAGKEVRIPWGEPVLWLSILAFILFTGVIAGSYPAFYLSSFRPVRVLKGTFRTGRWASLPRKVLVVLQFTVSIILIIGTIVVFNQIQHAKNRPVGYERDGLISMFVNTPDLNGKYDVLRSELLRTGAVEDMSQSSSPVTGVWSNQIGFEWEGKDPNTLPIFGIVACTHDFGNTVNWNVLEGRDFSRDFATDTSSLILNEAAKAYIGIEDIVGKTIQWDDDPYQVIGIVENMVMESPYKPIKPTIFTLNYDWANVINIRLKPGMPVQDALSSVEGVFKELNPGSPFDYQFVDENFEAKFRAEQRIGKLASVFAILAIFISCLGLLGLSAYVAEQRSKEIGIRKVLGASVSSVVALLSKDFLILVLIALLIATPLAWWAMNDWLQDYDYRIQVPWLVFAVTGFGALLIALLTVSSQAIKAAIANPVKAIRTE